MEKFLKILNVCKTVSKYIAITDEAIYMPGKYFLSSLYTSIIEPHLKYCVEVWSNACRSNLNPLYCEQLV